MRSERILSSDELTQMIDAVFAYNGLHAVDVAFDIRGGLLRVIVTVEDKPLRVADKPEPMDSMSMDVLRKMRERASA